ncbi:zinc finger protein 678-like, partial [Oppia nitens]|uniref:zinc finger protein 678-like n=1 Tax=Oppia nitens TaxID=1686743 RepID=UPI0023DB1D2B
CDINDCGKSFNSKSNLKNHKLNIHSNRRFKLHLKEKSFKCDVDYCGQIKTTLNQHKRTIHLGLKPFKCDVDNCGKQFRKKSNLSQHRQIHSAIKSFKCDRQHKQYLHMNIKPFKCDVDNCGKQFTIKSDLLKHQRNHSGIKPFKCEVIEFLKLFAHQSGE